jgi:hypothetical protein
MILPAILCVFAVTLSAARPETPGITPRETARLQALLDVVKSSPPQALARALGVELVTESEVPLSEENCLVALGTVNGGKTPTLALKWMPRPGASDGETAAQSAASVWQLFLLDWDGRRWVASGLMSGYEPFAVRALPMASDAGSLVAVVLYSQADEVPYPVIFRANGPSLAWDSRGDESRYEGYRGGQVRFRVEKGLLEMVATGRADPGLLVFSGHGPRGFDARSLYVWETGAFIPRQTEYSVNPDFTLYRFISALHLRDFPAAYALVDPRKFLQTDQPTLKLFQRKIEDTWPEFLDDRIFKARDDGAGDWSFTLRRKEEVYVYTPSFSGESPWRLTGLRRREQKPENE